MWLKRVFCWLCGWIGWRGVLIWIGNGGIEVFALQKIEKKFFRKTQCKHHHPHPPPNNTHPYPLSLLTSKFLNNISTTPTSHPTPTLHPCWHSWCKWGWRRGLVWGGGCLLSFWVYWVFEEYLFSFFRVQTLQPHKIQPKSDILHTNYHPHDHNTLLNTPTTLPLTILSISPPPPLLSKHTHPTQTWYSKFYKRPPHAHTHIW